MTVAEYRTNGVKIDLFLHRLFQMEVLGRRPRKGLSTTKSEKIQRPQIANSAVWSLELSLFLKNQSIKDRKVQNSVMFLLKIDYVYGQLCQDVHFSMCNTSLNK